jgi:hypothetical protein
VDNQGWLEIERQEGSVTVSRDHWFWVRKGNEDRAVQEPRRNPKSPSKPVDRAFVVAWKRVMIVERRDAGKVEACKTGILK